MTILFLCTVFMMAGAWSAAAQGRDSYAIRYGRVYFENNELHGADARSFRDLGYGYGKDSFSVFYCGKELRDAMASTFKVLGWGYAKDSFNVYYGSKVLKDAMPSTFRVLDNGYAEDAFNTWYRGSKTR